MSTTTAADAPVTTAEEALKLLAEGNKWYAEFKSMPLNEDEARRIEVSQGQRPFATIISCVDSRVPPELVFDRGLGDLFVIRSAGEALDQAVTGSVEFGVVEFSTPLVMVLGHESCGAVDASIKALEADGADHGEHGSIDYLVKAITPAVKKQVQGQPGDLLVNAVKAQHQAGGRPVAQVASDRSCRAWGQGQAGRRLLQSGYRPRGGHELTAPAGGSRA